MAQSTDPTVTMMTTGTVSGGPATDPCTLCQFIVSQAQSHYRSGESKKDVQKDLHDDCKTLRRFYGEQAVKECSDWVDTNIDVLYSEIQAGNSAVQICTDTGACGGTVTPSISPVSFAMKGAKFLF
ncbi:unnamed protein product, partial [Mesorhabditis belari]|uniref:Saposin B-type domain-containing protein n=1 Tax=Mesorhabditis belari TaxID=2138241 RepID=A0AAF3F867_9BILA